MLVFRFVKSRLTCRLCGEALHTQAERRHGLCAACLSEGADEWAEARSEMNRLRAMGEFEAELSDPYYETADW